MKPSKLIHQTSPAQLSEVRREITRKEYRQEHSTRDKKRLLATIEEIEKIINKLGYLIKIDKMKIIKISHQGTDYDASVQTYKAVKIDKMEKNESATFVEGNLHLKVKLNSPAHKYCRSLHRQHPQDNDIFNGEAFWNLEGWYW